MTTMVMTMTATMTTAKNEWVGPLRKRERPGLAFEPGGVLTFLSGVRCAS